MDATRLAGEAEFQDWEVLIRVAWDSVERVFAGGAELFHDGALKCRIALVPGFETDEQATHFLRARAASFIEDWRCREHHADSDFSEL